MINLNGYSERMYEAAFLPEKWVSLLDDLAFATNSAEGGIGSYWPNQKGIHTTHRICAERPQWQQSPEECRHWLTHVRSNRHVNQGFFQLDPFKGDWNELPDFEQRLENHKARGFGVQTGAILELFNGEIITLEFTRRFGAPRYDNSILFGLNGIHEAFRQSVFFASRLEFERARNSVDTLNDIGLPGALLSPQGQLLYTNSLFESVEHYTIHMPSGQISIRGNDTLRKTFAQAVELSATKSGRIPVPASDTRGPAVIHLMPMCREARSIFSMSCTIMVIAPVCTTAGVPSPELVSDIFALTKTEARLATTLASGLSLRDSAAKQGITIGTARGYLIRIFSKTQTAQQSELVSLLKGIPTKDVSTITWK